MNSWNHFQTLRILYISAYKKDCSTNHVLTRLIESWKSLLDLWKGLVQSIWLYSSWFRLTYSEFHAYDPSFDTTAFLNAYSKDKKQRVTPNKICSIFKKILCGVHRGSILGPILFNMFLNDLLLCLKNCDLHNFADDKTVVVRFYD